MACRLYFEDNHPGPDLEQGRWWWGGHTLRAGPRCATESTGVWSHVDDGLESLSLALTRQAACCVCLRVCVMKLNIGPTLPIDGLGRVIPQKMPVVNLHLPAVTPCAPDVSNPKEKHTHTHL